MEYSTRASGSNLIRLRSGWAAESSSGPMALVTRDIGVKGRHADLGDSFMLTVTVTRVFGGMVRHVVKAYMSTLTAVGILGSFMPIIKMGSEGRNGPTAPCSKGSL